MRRVGGSRSAVQAPALWLVGLAVPFCAYFLLLLYCDLLRPANIGFVAGPSPDGHVVVTAVNPATAAALAGVQVGDRILSVNGASVLSVDAWGAIGANFRLDAPMAMVVQRQGRTSELRLALAPAPFSYWRGRAGVVLLTVRTAQLLTLFAGLFIVWRRPRDVVAVTASWLLLTCAVFNIALPLRFATVWRELPGLLGALLFLPYASSLAVGPVLLTFLATFPRRLAYARHVQVATWLLGGLALAPPLFNFIDLVYGSGHLRSVGPGTRPLLVVTIVSLAASLVLFLANYRRIQDVNERRRLRAVVAGTTAALMSAFPPVAWYWYKREADLAASLFESPALAFAAVGMLCLPLSITYAVLRHRLFDISFIIRQGLRYAFARRLLLSLLPALVLLLAFDLFAHAHETINTVMRKRGLLYIGVGVLAVGIYFWRQRWLDALDRRFFRERQDGYAVLREVAEHLRRTGSLDRVASRVVAKIESAMHPEFAALLAHNRRESLFRTVAAAPAASAVPDLAGDSKLVALARVLEKPLDTSDDTDGILKELPDSERAFVGRARMDLLVPVVTPDAQLFGLLALGRKRSEEPYSQEDLDVLVTIAENVALLAARSVPERQSPPLEECLECGGCYEAGARICDRCSRPLVMRTVPRTLAARYRLDQRIAMGGMGTVYEAFDTALDRRVAVKVVREELAAATGAVERFFDEARLAARLMHPNIVTVHDFGVVEDSRQPFLVMERLVGRTLRQELEDSPGQVDATLSILRGVCMAVDAAHRLRLLHRDLKPENIFLVRSEAEPVPKILDFGVARPFISSSGAATRRGTRPGVLVGTLEYMAPEQLRGGPPSAGWDLWSVAMIALETLTASTELARSRTSRPRDFRVAAGDGWDPAMVIRDTWPHAAGFFARALSLDGEQRPTTARSLFLQLEQALRADGVVTDGPAGGRA